MKRTLYSRVALIALFAATSGCTSSVKRTALPEGTRFTAATDASSVAAARLLADGNYGLAIEMYRRILVATPDDAARVVAFLASDEAAQVTGQVIRARGGN